MKKNLIKLSPKFETGSEKRKHICYDLSHNALAIDFTTVWRIDRHLRSTIVKLAVFGLLMHAYEENRCPL